MAANGVRGALLDKQPIIELAGYRPGQMCGVDIHTRFTWSASNVAMDSESIYPYAEIQGRSTIVGVDSYLFMMTIMALLRTRPPHDDGS